MMRRFESAEVQFGNSQNNEILSNPEKQILGAAHMENLRPAVVGKAPARLGQEQRGVPHGPTRLGGTSAQRPLS